jgi:FG-GAP repeat
MRRVYCILMVWSVLCSLNGFVWGQELFEDFVLYPEDTIEHGIFGYSVAVSDSVVVVGSAAESDAISGVTSAISVYDIVTGEAYAQRVSLYPGGVTGLLDYQIDIQGDLAIVGSPTSYDVLYRKTTGLAFLIDLSDPWTPRVRSMIRYPLDPNPGQNDYEYFGGRVAISGDRAVITAYRAQVDGVESGRAFIFDILDPDHPVHTHTLRGDDGFNGQAFGLSLDASGGIVAVGGLDGDQPPGTWVEAVYLYDLYTGTPLGKILSVDPDSNGHFGSTIALGEGVLAVGAPWMDSQNGLVVLFELGQGEEIARFRGGDGPGSNFGSMVRIDGHLLLIGAMREGTDGIGTGAGYLYDLRTHELLNRLTRREPRIQTELGSVFDMASGSIMFGLAFDRPDDTGPRTGSLVRFTAPCTSDLNADFVFDAEDINDLILDQIDMNMDGEFNYFDVSLFMLGCPTYTSKTPG